MKKTLIFGINGQVGIQLKNVQQNYNIIEIDRNKLDLNNTDQIKRTIDFYKPDLIINAAAYTNVDMAEIEKDIALKINKIAPKEIAIKAKELDIPCIFFSTNYVFNGKKSEPYNETDICDPLNFYGNSKLAGEEAVQNVGGKYYIFRTSCVYSKIRENFYSKILGKIELNQDKIKVINDQVSTPTSNLFIAEQLYKIIPLLSESNAGVYHLVPDGKSSCFHFAIEIIKKKYPLYDLNNIIPISSKSYKTSTKRPLFSILNNSKIKSNFNLKFNDWLVEFERFLNKA